MFASINPWRNRAAAEAVRRRSREVTYTLPLGMDAIAAVDSNDADLAALQQFLKDFYPQFYSREREAHRRTVLEEYPEVAMYAQLLIPKVVSSEEFWQRYEYRCDEEAILKEWERHPHRGRQLIKGAVTNWWDEQIKAVKQSVTDATTPPSKTITTTTSTAANSSRDSCSSSGSGNNGTTDEGCIDKSSSNSSDSIDKKQIQNGAGIKQNMKPYVIPQRRRSSNSNSNSNSSESRSEASFNSRAKGLRQAPPQKAETSIAAKDPQESSNRKNDTSFHASTSDMTTKSKTTGTTFRHSSKARLLVLLCAVCFMMIPFATKQVLSRRILFCSSCEPPLIVDPWWSSGISALSHRFSSLVLCRGVEKSPLFASKKMMIKDTKKVRIQQKQNRNHHYQDESSPIDKDNTIAAVYPDNSYFGGGSRSNNKHEGSDNDGGLVQSLISSWMQDTDMTQFQTYDGSTSSSASSWWSGGGQNSGKTTEPPPSDQTVQRGGGLVGFFRRKFRRNRSPNNHALATPAQPQMVVHQHIHHVVHHVVHEVKQS